jgi:hypothetical protein
MAFENRRYVIIPASEINNVNFAEVLETSADTCRYSVDGTTTFVKYEGEMPVSVAAITGKSQEYSHSEILDILSTEEWTLPNQEL